MASARSILGGFAVWFGLAIWAAAMPAMAQSDAEQSSRQADTVVEFDIPAQPLSSALIQLSQQAGVQVVMEGERANGASVSGLNGEYTIEDALDLLLMDTGFTAARTGPLTYTVKGPADAAVAGQNQIGQRRSGIEEIIVTGQKREERIQDVPIAISAFSPEDLEAQKIEGGFDLLKGVPNVTFSKTNFTGYNFQIRGIGTQAISATTDPAVAVSFNNTTLIVNRLFEQEYLDVERVEVLRGPQGTLFGRNATSGVINVISNKPELGVWDGMVDVEVGNYNSQRLRGFFNAPIGDTFAIRGAYASTKRDGFGINEAHSDPLTDVSRDVDDRDLWTGRITLGWQPIDRLRFNLLWERFEEDDRRVRTSKQLCHRDPGPEFIGDFEVAEHFHPLYSDGGPFSQGCLPGSLYSDDAYGAPHGGALPFTLGAFFAGVLGNNPYPVAPLLEAFTAPRCENQDVFAGGFPLATMLDICNGLDPYSKATPSRDLRTIYSALEPSYQAKSDIIELSFDLELTDNLLFSSQTVYVDDEIYATQDFNRFETNHGVFQDTLAPSVVPGVPAVDPVWADLAPGGIYTDPQLGASDTLVVQDLSRGVSEQFNQEFRLVSSFGGPWNFSIGANFTDFKTLNDYFVFANVLTLIAESPLFRSPDGDCGESGFECIYIDPNPLDSINDEGHNYFRSANPYELTSTALFGELYWQATETVKFTAGLRFTWDRKVFTPVPSQLLLYDYREIGSTTQSGGYNFNNPLGTAPENCRGPFGACEQAGNAPGGRGYPADADIIQEWREPTGRLVVDWQPVLEFTDETMVYASFSRGYKGGGANPPSIAPPAGLFIAEQRGADAPPTFEPEYINAYELGTKNTLFGGALTLNGTAFYYDYTDYQVSKIVDRSAANENFDAEIWGLEFESIFAPSLNWQFNAAIGYLQTEVANGERSIDLMDRTQGGNQSFGAYDEWMVIKPWIQKSSNCVVPVALVEAEYGNAAPFPGNLCLGGNIFGSTFLSDEDGGQGNVVPRTNSGSSVEWERGDWADHPDYNASEGGVHFNPATDAPNAGAGFFADLSGNELPNAPHFTVSLGGQYNFDLTRDWRATARVDYYWQDESYARIYNTEYDRLKSWSNTNLSFWATNEQWGVTVEAYVKNLFDETPITGTFLNSDDTALSTNVFTLDPRLIGVSVRKEF